ncbi:hypothetical protein QP547_00355 [Weeksella virosa]|uniref:hypothetical protein n=1 Tax=Weeksella virosa TaxID=1014 RepID=UPI00255452A4|nr:hypothetical protein [Weeksella virosa]MDK7674264.1 hypothetical protein [Weeksella virosa]
MKKIILLLSIGLSLQQCKKDLPIIDSKTEITFNSSFDEIAKKLPSLQQEKLKEALYIIYEYNTKAKTTEARWAIVRQLLDGKNSDEIFTLAETLAKENGFSWNRNQAPYPGGIPVMEQETITENAPDMDLQMHAEVSNVGNGIHIYPSISEKNGSKLNNDQALSVTTDVLSNHQIIYTQKNTIPSQAYDLMSSFDGFTIHYAHLDPTKIYTNTLDLVIRVPHPSRYLSLKKQVRIPDQYVKGVKIVSDSIMAEAPAEIGKTNPLATRFLQNIVKGNRSGAYAISKISDYSSFNDFANDVTLGKLENAKITSNEIINANEKRVEVRATLVDEKGTSKDYSVIVEKIDNRWFVTSFQ